MTNFNSKVLGAIAILVVFAHSSVPAQAQVKMNLSVFHQGISENGQLWYSYFDGKKWAPDVQVPNVGMSFSPSAVAMPGGGISVFHQGPKVQAEPVGLNTLSGVLTELMVARQNQGVFPGIFLPDGQLWYSYFDGKKWAPDVQVPNVGMSGSPSAVALPGGGISVFHQGVSFQAFQNTKINTPNGQLWCSYFDGKKWAPDVQVPNVGMSVSPSAVAMPGGGISVFHQGISQNGQLWYSYFDGKKWAPDVQVPNVGMSESPSAVVF